MLINEDFKKKVNFKIAVLKIFIRDFATELGLPERGVIFILKGRMMPSNVSKSSSSNEFPLHIPRLNFITKIMNLVIGFFFLITIYFI